jgi:crotonobetainyl-CoA:carnitine CoA-transferase CaiB-like acyl-CoA transferase
MGPVPGLGEHTDTVLAALGLSPAEIMDLRDREVL